MKRMSDQEREKVLNLWEHGLYSANMISKEIGFSRVAICKFLNRHGIDTARRRLKVACNNCGDVVLKTRASMRKSRNHFCSTLCYGIWLKTHGPRYTPWRQGQRVARKVVEGYYGELPEDSVVHHEDGSNFNNAPSNLVLFKGQADHVRWHRGIGRVEPLWSLI